MTWSPSQVFIGVDVGTTTSKALVRTSDQRDVCVVEAATPWQTYPDGRTETDPQLLSDLASQLIARGVRLAEASIGAVQVRGIGVTGMGECGVLLDRYSTPAAPVMAWFDPRGEQDVDRLAAGEPGFAERFESKTGLPWSYQASIAKLIWLRENGTRIGPGARWLSIPEWIVYQLGGEQVREPSLASRTGLIDQNTGEPWPDGFAAAGLAASLLPDELAAGQVAGFLRAGVAPTGGAPALLTVAGHDHAVAALGASPARRRRSREDAAEGRLMSATAVKSAQADGAAVSGLRPGRPFPQGATWDGKGVEWSCSQRTLSESSCACSMTTATSGALTSGIAPRCSGMSMCPRSAPVSDTVTGSTDLTRRSGACGSTRTQRSLLV